MQKLSAITSNQANVNQTKMNDDDVCITIIDYVLLMGSDFLKALESCTIDEKIPPILALPFMCTINVGIMMHYDDNHDYVVVH